MKKNQHWFSNNIINIAIVFTTCILFAAGIKGKTDLLQQENEHIKMRITTLEEALKQNSDQHTRIIESQSNTNIKLASIETAIQSVIKYMERNDHDKK